MGKIWLLSLLPLLLLISACSTHIGSVGEPDSSQPTLPVFNTSLFPTLPNTIAPETVAELNRAQEKEFFKYFNNPSYQNIAPNLRAYNYLSLVLDQLTYSNETLTAEQTLSSRSGNCLSLANLTKAIAKLANVDIAFHLMDNDPVFDFQNSLLTRTNHIRAVLKGNIDPFISEDSFSQFSTITHLRIDYFPTKQLRYLDGMSNAMQTSLYFSNLAVEYITSERYPEAYAHAKAALKIAPSNSSALNTMGIIHARLGDQKTAEDIYLYGGQHLREKMTFHKNLTMLLESQGRHDEAQLLYEKTLTDNNIDPWHWIRLGLREHQQTNYTQAIKYFNQALTIVPYSDKIHFYKARTYFAKGEKKQAENHLKQAIQHAEKSSSRANYKEKLYALRKT